MLLQLSPEVRDLLDRILVPKEEERITIPAIEQHPWCAPCRRAEQCSSPATCLDTHARTGRGSERKLCAHGMLLDSLACPSRRYQKPLPAQYANAERALKADQAKVQQYVSGRSISTVRGQLSSTMSSGYVRDSNAKAGTPSDVSGIAPAGSQAGP